MSNLDHDIDALWKTFKEELIAREQVNTQLARRCSDESKDARADPHCCYCQELHPSMSCTSVVDPLKRKQILKASGRFLNCFWRNHCLRNCKSSSPFLKFKKKHHNSICDVDQVKQISISCPSSLCWKWYCSELVRQHLFTPSGRLLISSKELILLHT